MAVGGEAALGGSGPAATRQRGRGRGECAKFIEAVW